MQPDAVSRAQALVGIRFRPQGRDPGTGLDCVGLVLRAYELPARSAPANYRLRGDHLSDIDRSFERFFRRVSRRQAQPGDILVLRVSPDQLHLAVLCPGSFVHADARIGRVVETPVPPSWPVQRAFRRRQQREI